MKVFLSKNGLGLLFVALTVALIVAVVSTVPADAANQGNILFKQRYGATSTTPIDDIDNLNGVTSNVQTQLDAKTSSSLADTKVNVGNASGVAAPQSITISGDGTASMTNAGVMSMTLAANSVGTSALFVNSVNLTVANTATYNTVTVDEGHQYMGYYLSTVGGINGTNLVNAPEYVGSGVWKISMVNALDGGDATWTLVFISDN
jgi:hypothetical protein